MKRKVSKAESWETRFKKEFLRDYQNDCFSYWEVMSFIRNLLAQQRNEVRRETIEEIRKKVEGLKKKGRFLDQASDAQNYILQEVLEELENK